MTNIRSAVILRPSDYDVVWDGTHGDCDADLLDRRLAVPHKIEAVTDTRDVNLRALLRHTLYSATAPMLLIDIAHRLETSTLKINSALYAMKERGEVVTIETTTKRAWGQVVMLYSLAPDVRGKLDSEAAARQATFTSQQVETPRRSPATFFSTLQRNHDRRARRRPRHGQRAGAGA